MNHDLDVAFHISIAIADPTSNALSPLLADLRAAGYRRAVLPPLDPATTDAVALRRAYDEAEMVPIVMTGQSLAANVSSADEDERRAGAAVLRAAVDFAVSLGSDQLNGVPYGLFGSSDAPTSRSAFVRASREVGVVADYAADQGVMMTFEVLNRYETPAINTAAQAVEFAEMSGSDNLRIHLDTFHMAIEEADMSAAIRTALPRLGYLELGQSGRGHLSTGAVDVAAVVRQALDDGYTGRWGVEAFSRPLVGETAGDMLSIWRRTFEDGLAVASDATRVISNGWMASVPGRRAQRLTRRVG